MTSEDSSFMTAVCAPALRCVTIISALVSYVRIGNEPLRQLPAEYRDGLMR
jgi:hypothetical protein